MIRALGRPRVVLIGMAAALLYSVGFGLTSANVIPATHIGAAQLSLPESVVNPTGSASPSP